MIRPSNARLDESMKRLYDANFPKFSKSRIIDVFLKSVNADAREAYLAFDRIHNQKVNPHRSSSFNAMKVFSANYGKARRSVFS